jgi:hypothetical protein
LEEIIEVFRKSECVVYIQNVKNYDNP